MKISKIFVCFLFSCFLFSCNNPDKKLDYEGISFSYPSYWDVESQKTEDGNIYIDAEEKFDKSTIFLVILVQAHASPLEMIDSYLNRMSQELRIEKEPSQAGKFGKYDVSFANYKAIDSRQTSYGQIYTFNMDKKTILVIKQSDKEYDLKHEKYKIIESSFHINP